MSGHLWSHDRDLWPRWRHQWESVGDMKQTCCCYQQCQFLTLVSIEKVFCSSVLKRMYCERCLLKHLQFIAKTFLVASKTFSKDHLLFPSPQTFCFIEKEWWKLWDKTKWINMVSWQFCHLQVVNLQNCTKWPACKVTMDIPSNFQVKSNSTWFVFLKFVFKNFNPFSPTGLNLDISICVKCISMYLFSYLFTDLIW